MTDVSWLLGRRVQSLACQHASGNLSFPHGFSQLRWKRMFLFSRGRLNMMSLRHLPFHYPTVTIGRLRTSLRLRRNF
jgi:hypothetical protein